MNVEKVIDHIVNWLSSYNKQAGTNGFVVGVSGGIDFAVTTTLAARTGLSCVCLEMPIHQSVNSSLRARVTPAQRGKGRQLKGPNESPDQTPTEHRAAMTWAQGLKRVFNIDVETCRDCGGAVKVTALAHSATAPCVALPPASMQSPAPAALVHPCTSLLASKIRRS